MSPAVAWCPGKPLHQTQQQIRSRCCLGQGCPCPLATNTSVCPVPHRCGHSCVRAPLLGTPTSHCQLAAAGDEGMGQEAGPTRRKRWGWQEAQDMAQVGWDEWVSSERVFHVGRQIMREGDSRNLAICTGQMEGEPRRSSSRWGVSSRLGCVRKQAGLSPAPEPPLLPTPAAHVQPRQCPARSVGTSCGLRLPPSTLSTGEGGGCPMG